MENNNSGAAENKELSSRKSMQSDIKSQTTIQLMP